jgi:hypothetical protein
MTETGAEIDPLDRERALTQLNIGFRLTQA